ncbi:MAG: hypothetical protein ABF264_08080 [Flavobacteriales bacterium]|jgi:hypothetical protein
MKKVVLFLALSLLVLSFNELGDKLKVKFKKGTILVEKEAWGKFERTGGKSFYSTLAGIEFVSVNGLSYGTGKYYNDSKGVRREYMHFYAELHFLTTDLEKFETDLVGKSLIRAFIKEGVIQNDELNLENVKKFKTKYEDNISEKRFLTK